jgi:hypothetical protein
MTGIIGPLKMIGPTTMPGTGSTETGVIGGAGTSIIFGGGTGWPNGGGGGIGAGTTMNPGGGGPTQPTVGFGATVTAGPGIIGPPKEMPGELMLTATVGVGAAAGAGGVAGDGVAADGVGAEIASGWIVCARALSTGVQSKAARANAAASILSLPNIGVPIRPQEGIRFVRAEVEPVTRRRPISPIVRVAE